MDVAGDTVTILWTECRLSLSLPLASRDLSRMFMYDCDIVQSMNASE